MGLKGIERLYSRHRAQLTLHSLQGKKNGNVKVENYLKERLLSLLCFIIHGQGSSEKGLISTVRLKFI